MIANKKQKPNYNEEFDYAVQFVLLCGLITDSTAFAVCQNILSDTYFDDKLRKCVRFILDYSNEYRAIPDIAVIKAKSGVELEHMTNLNYDWLTKEVEKFCRYKALELAILDGAQLLHEGRGSEIEKLVRDAMTISLMSDLGTNFFANPKQSLIDLRDNSPIISTGWKSIDRILYGGLAPGLNVFVAPPGVGKSLLLQNLALNWVLSGRRVVYVTLELSEKLTNLRLSSMLTGYGTKKVLSNVDDSSFVILNHGKKSGTLHIKKLPQGGTTVNDLRAYLKEYEIQNGCLPDAMLVDYLDLLFPNDRRIDISNFFLKDKVVSEELRELYVSYNMYGATASQIGRSGFQTEDFDMSNISGGVSKSNSSDVIAAISSNQAYKNAGKMQIQFLKTRASTGTGQRVDLKYCPVSMRITDDDEYSEELFEEPKSNSDLKKEIIKKVEEEPKKMEMSPGGLLDFIKQKGISKDGGL